MVLRAVQLPGIHHADGTATININQTDFNDEWVSLGSYYFTTSGGHVYLGDATGTPGQRIAFDAVRWSAPGTGIEEQKTKPKLSYHLLSSIAKNAIVIIVTGNRQHLDFKIYDIAGQCVSSGRRYPDKNRIEISVAELPTGMYFIRLDYGGSLYSEKFIIAR